MAVTLCVSLSALAASGGAAIAESADAAGVAAAPMVTVTPVAGSVTAAQDLSVTVKVSGPAARPVPAGTVTLTSGSYASRAVTLVKGGASFRFPARELAAGRDTLTVRFEPSKAGAAHYKGATGKGVVTVTRLTPEIRFITGSTSVSAAQLFRVTVVVTGNSRFAPVGTITLVGGGFRSGAMPLVGGDARVHIAPGNLAAGSDMLKATFTPSGESASIYKTVSAELAVTVAKVTPAIAITPAATSIDTAQALAVAIAVTAPAGDATPTGTVTVGSGSYLSTPAALANGAATIQVPAGSLAAGSETLTGAYTPDKPSAAIYNTASRQSTAVEVAQVSMVSVDLENTGPAVTNQILGVNMAAWFDPTNAAIVPALETAGIQAIRWPGGSWSDDYHWANNTLCSGTPDSNATFANLISGLVTPSGVDVALTADYGTNAACTGPGDPTEAAAWAAYALKNGANVSHITVGNEEYGSWETDMHSKPNDATTYAGAVAGDSGYYALIKAASPDVLVGVSVNPGNYPEWDPIVLGNAPYDFVEYHYYPQGPGQESDAYLVQQAANDLTGAINTIKSELKTAGKANTPIYVGEIGSVYTDPGKQSTSITQALYAGQVLGEMMNDGVSRGTWWIGFGGCNDASDGGNFSSSLYGWQNFGGYMIFSDGTPEYGCYDATPPVAEGTLLPTARAFQLFSAVAVNGESVLSPVVTGDTADVRAYAATHSGGTALVLFNLNETASEAVQIALSGQSASSDVSVATYSKAIYDQSKNNVWAAPASTDMGAQSLPLTLTLTPWSMNVVIVK